MPTLTIEILVVDELFDRYTILIDAANKITSVYCTECEQWVNSYDGDQLTKQTEAELFSQIVTDHSEQVMGTPVSFDTGL